MKTITETDSEAIVKMGEKRAKRSLSLPPSREATIQALGLILAQAFTREEVLKIAATALEDQNFKSGDVARITGDISRITGDVTRITGDISHLTRTKLDGKVIKVKTEDNVKMD